MVSPEDLARQLLSELAQSLSLSLRRDLIETVNGGYRFQEELIRRWFAQATQMSA